VYKSRNVKTVNKNESKMKVKKPKKVRNQRHIRFAKKERKNASRRKDGKLNQMKSEQRGKKGKNSRRSSVKHKRLSQRIEKGTFGTGGRQGGWNLNEKKEYSWSEEDRMDKNKSGKRVKYREKKTRGLDAEERLMDKIVSNRKDTDTREKMRRLGLYRMGVEAGLMDETCIIMEGDNGEKENIKRGGMRKKFDGRNNKRNSKKGRRSRANKVNNNSGGNTSDKKELCDDEIYLENLRNLGLNGPKHWSLGFQRRAGLESLIERHHRLSKMKIKNRYSLFNLSDTQEKEAIEKVDTTIESKSECAGGTRKRKRAGNRSWVTYWEEGKDIIRVVLTSFKGIRISKRVAKRSIGLKGSNWTWYSGGKEWRDEMLKLDLEYHCINMGLKGGSDEIGDIVLEETKIPEEDIDNKEDNKHISKSEARKKYENDRLQEKERREMRKRRLEKEKRIMKRRNVGGGGRKRKGDTQALIDKESVETMSGDNPENKLSDELDRIVKQDYSKRAESRLHQGVRDVVSSNDSLVKYDDLLSDEVKDTFADKAFNYLRDLFKIPRREALPSNVPEGLFVNDAKKGTVHRLLDRKDVTDVAGLKIGAILKQIMDGEKIVKDLFNVGPKALLDDLLKPVEEVAVDTEIELRDGLNVIEENKDVLSSPLGSFEKVASDLSSAVIDYWKRMATLNSRMSDGKLNVRGRKDLLNRQDTQSLDPRLMADQKHIMNSTKYGKLEEVVNDIKQFDKKWQGEISRMDGVLKDKIPHPETTKQTLIDLLRISNDNKVKSIADDAYRMGMPSLIGYDLPGPSERGGITDNGARRIFDWIENVSGRNRLGTDVFRDVWKKRSGRDEMVRDFMVALKDKLVQGRPFLMSIKGNFGERAALVLPYGMPWTDWFGRISGGLSFDQNDWCCLDLDYGERNNTVLEIVPGGKISKQDIWDNIGIPLVLYDEKGIVPFENGNLSVPLKGGRVFLNDRSTAIGDGLKLVDADRSQALRVLESGWNDESRESWPDDVAKTVDLLMTNLLRRKKKLDYMRDVGKLDGKDPEYEIFDGYMTNRSRKGSDDVKGWEEIKTDQGTDEKVWNDEVGNRIDHWFDVVDDNLSDDMPEVDSKVEKRISQLLGKDVSYLNNGERSQLLLDKLETNDLLRNGSSWDWDKKDADRMLDFESWVGLLKQACDDCDIMSDDAIDDVATELNWLRA